MFFTRIRVYDLNNSGLLDAVLRELPDMCETFTCYPKEGLIIVQSSQGAIQIEDGLRARSINMEHMICKMI